MQLTGKIKRIEQIKQVTESYKNRELIIVTEEQYPQTISIQFGQDKVTLLDPFAVDDKVKIDINIKGKEVVKDGVPPKVFNTIIGWKIEKVA